MNTNGMGKVQVFATNAGKELGTKISQVLGTNLGEARLARFKDGEVDVQILENVRGNDVFIVAPTQPPAENLLEAVHMAEAARLSSAARVTLVIPYFGYGRADRKDAPRKAIGARLAFKLLEIAHPDRFLMLDLHAEQTLASVDNAVTDHLYGSAVGVPYLKKLLDGKDFVIASPDRGGGARAIKYATLLGHDDFVFFSKQRSAPGEVKSDSIKIIGDVKDKLVVLVDDMIDSGGTIVADAAAAKAEGASGVWAFATHGLFSGGALEKFKASAIDRVFTTDSVYHDPEELKAAKVEVISVASLLADAIKRTHDGESLSTLIS
ncbi:MAG TPA: ribose-phosphate diphosphokinase [Candidatus Paceibacterota bacterium]|nr:ribose-phosphate diphosphokinase [Candidatus Paceibacterota bacterium]